MDDLEHVTFLGPHRAVLGARDDLAVPLDRNGAVREPEVLHDAGQSEPSRNLADFAVDGETHARNGGALPGACQ